MSLEIPIVLTGTIVPNTNVRLQHLDPEIRRREYLNCINFYRSFAPVYFLENSAYPVEEDREFTSIPNVKIRKFPLSSFPEKGRGFQEFQMLDAWVKSEHNIPSKWLKVTGRYLYTNISEILSECDRHQDKSLIINQYLSSNRAVVALFFANTEYYKQNLMGIYNICDDEKDLIIERAINFKLRFLEKTEFKRFKTYPEAKGSLGGSGKEMSNDLTDKINSFILNANYAFDRHYIWLSF